MSRPGIVFGVDENYLEPFLVTLTSLAASGGVTGDVASISVLHTDLGPEASQRIQHLAAQLDLDVSITLAEGGSERFPVTDWISPAAYLRLQIPDALPSFDRVLYLDCDLITVGSITELLDLQPTNVLAAVQDITNRTLGEGDAVPGFSELGLSADQPYFNSGVMLIDLDAWIDTSLTDRCVRRLLEQPQHIKYWDQDALNIELADEGWTRLGSEFNAIVVSAYEAIVAASGDQLRIEAVRAGAAIEATAHVLHFAGPFKPWNPGYPDSAARDRYTAYVELCRRIESGEPAKSAWASEAVQP